VKLYAQHGFQAGEKLKLGFSRGLIDGVVFSPRDISPENLKTQLAELRKQSPEADLLFDPQYYACFFINSENARLGHLTEYEQYFKTRRRNQLEREKQISEDLKASFDFQMDLGVSGIIAPNVHIPRSFNSIEAGISKNFIRLAGDVYKTYKTKKPLYATLSISRNALTDKQELKSFLNDITLLDNPPDGFYVLIAAQNSEARFDIYNADVIAAWMLINYSLKLNGFKVINGYSDILTPFLGIAGAIAGSTGWWSNLRTFSLDRFNPLSSGGKLPNQRYLSKKLLNRIYYYELDSLKNARISEVLNGLPSDEYYDNDGSTPERNVEVIQAWDAIKSLNSEMVGKNIIQNLQNCNQLIDNASDLYLSIPSVTGLQLEAKSNKENLEPLKEGVKLFAELAEIDLPKN